jgi:hypothetical protein
VKVDKSVVSRVRKNVEATGASVPVEKRTGKDGKARKQPKKKREERNYEIIDAEGRTRKITHEEAIEELKKPAEPGPADSWTVHATDEAGGVAAAPVSRQSERPRST